MKLKQGSLLFPSFGNDLCYLGSKGDLIAYVYEGTNTLVVDFQNTFLLTYRSFATPSEVLDGLIAGYVELMKKGDGDPDTKGCRLR